MDIDDSSSPDEREFPGLYERNASKSKKGATDDFDPSGSNSSENFEKKPKDKKAKDKKDRQSYEALGGGSEEDDGETKLFRSPSKSKKLKTFKFPTSVVSKKEKREKSREPESKDVTDSVKEKKVKEDPKSEKKKSKKEKKSKSNSISGEAFELGGESCEIFLSN